MKYVSEYRDAAAAEHYRQRLQAVTTRPWSLMELCGGQTRSIVRFGIDRIIPPEITLIHGPGCPVCVTPIGMIDSAIALGRRSDVTLCSFGDMLRVPGTDTDLLTIKAGGGDIRIVYSPMDALELARQNPIREVVFFAVGFETTAPTTATAAWLARHEKLRNFSLLVSHVRVPPAMEAILSSPTNRVQAFLAAGHVCTVMGMQEYYALADRYKVPIVATGFEPLDLLQGILMAVKQLEEGRHEVENQYTRAVRPVGNLHAQRHLSDVFEIGTRPWRGLGPIEGGALVLRPEYQDMDAAQRFSLPLQAEELPGECISGLVLQGQCKPPQCPAFGTRCTPEHPLGASMVSTEGACSAYYIHRRREVEQHA